MAWVRYRGEGWWGRGGAQRAVVECGVVWCGGNGGVTHYWYAVEKVYVVWSGAARKKRLRSPIYLACLSVVGVYMGVAIFLILGSFFLHLT